MTQRQAGIRLGLGISLAGALLLPISAWAQKPPDSGQILRDIQPNLNEVAPPLPPPQAIPEEAPAPKETGIRILVKGFHIVASQFPESVLQEVVKKYVGRELSIAELDEAARQISEYYRAHDLLAHAYIPKQTVKDGIVEIDVLEGRLGKVRVDPSSQVRLDQGIAAGIVADRAPLGQPLRPSQVQEGLAVLNEVPGVAATSVLESGANQGESDVVLKLQDTPIVTGSALVDNESANSVGSVRAIGNVLVNDAFGHGEQFTTTVMKTLDSTYGRLAAAAPVNHSALTLGIDGSYLKYNVLGPFSAVGADGFAYTVGGTLSYPMRRTSDLSLTLTGTADAKRLIDNAGGVNTDDRKIEVATLGVSGASADQILGGGFNTFGVSGTLGHLDYGGVSSLLMTAGGYGKTSVNASRSQNVIDKVTFFLSGQGQMAAKNLDSSEQISLGGPTGVRAYPVNEASGDEGAIGTAELRWDPFQQLRVFGFYDIGAIVQHVETTPANYTGTPDDYVLQGAGIGFSWSPFPMAQIKATVAHTIGENAGRNPTSGDDADGRRLRIRPWLQAVITF